MPVRKLVSASIAPETKNQILSSLAEMKGKLGLLLTLGPSEAASGLFRAEKEYGSFLDGCYAVAQTHPEILPPSFSTAEFDRDYQLAEDLEPISHALNELGEAVGRILTAAPKRRPGLRPRRLFGTQAQSR
jgi:hypothetical protein